MPTAQESSLSSSVETLSENSALAREWDHFAANCRSVHLEQFTSWGELRKFDGWSPSLIALRFGPTLVGGALILTRRINRLLSVGYVFRGPLVAPGNEVREAAVARRVIAELKRFAHAWRLAVLIVDPPYFAGLLPAVMTQAGFVPHLQRLPPTSVMRGTLLLNLRATDEALLARMRRSTRKLLRKSVPSDFRVRRGVAADIDTLWRLMNELCRRRGTRPNVPSAEYMHRLWKTLGPSGAARIDVLESQSEPLVVLLTLCLGSWAVPWRIGWSGAEAKLSPEKVLYWSVIRSLRDAGYSVFDLNWVDPDEVDAIRTGREFPDSVNTGITGFKMGMGGEVFRLAQPMDYFPNPLARLAFRLGAGRFANSVGFARVLSSINRRRG